MKQYSKRYELKNTAKDSLRGKYGVAILVCMTHFFITSTALMLKANLTAPLTRTLQSMDSGSTTPILFYYLFSGVLEFIFSSLLGVLQLGLALFFLNIACGQPYALGNLFYGYKYCFQKALTLSAVGALLDVLCHIPGQYVIDLYQMTGNVKFLYGGIAASIVGLCIYIPVNLAISLCYFLMLDFPDQSPKEILQLSIRTMQGHKRRLFFIELSFLPLAGLCILTFYVCFLWLLPYMQMTYALFFLDLMNPKDAEDSYR